MFCLQVTKTGPNIQVLWCIWFFKCYWDENSDSVCKPRTQGLYLQHGESLSAVTQVATCTITFDYAAGEKCFLPNLYLYIV